ncbi:thyroid transcription factor 1-associated protein 26 homolog isoform X2 [Eriocheir sinensis]|uniref:thyroid transcription factor 1-associated protein 26 homolog isoform X2 n=1 Tax=Eriocheir sinensis TaxID=95602 RepID=UPI0021C5EB9A|nr:thyroid transcription factor 1-associated protein 26 homolog isoform X2 [Eriocheir sinensis]
MWIVGSGSPPGHGRAFLQKRAVVRQHLRLKNKTLAKEMKQLHDLHNVCEEGAAETKVENRLTDASTDDSPLSSSPRKNRPNNLRRARAAYKKKIEEKQQKQEEVTSRREEAEAAKKKYKEKRLHRFKKLSQKTRKGQPVMRGKIELMLEALQQSANS